MADRTYNLAITASDGFSGAFRKLLGDLDRAESASARLRNAMLGLASAFGVSLSFAGLASMLKDTIDAAARLDDLSERTGAAVEELSKFAGVARITGQDLGQVESSLAKLSKAIVESQDATSKEAQAFRAFGISVRDTEGKLKTSGTVLDELSRKQGDFADGAGKSAAMMALLGKTGDQLIPFLNDYVRLADQVAVTTADDAKAAEDFNIELGLMREKFDRLLRDAILPLLPQMRELIRTFEGLGKAIADLSPAGKGPLEGLLASIRETNIQTIGEIAYLKQAWENFLAWWKANSVMDILGRLGGKPAKDVQMIPPTAARDAAILTERNRLLVAATRELPPLMESTATATKKAGVSFREAGDSAKYVNVWLDEMQRMTKELDAELAVSKKFWDDLGKTMEAAGRIAQKHDEEMQRGVDTLAEQLAALKAEGEEIGLSQKALDALTLSRLDSNIARKQEQLLVAQGIPGMESEVAVLQQQLSLLQQIRDASASNQQRRVMADQAREATDAWRRMWDDITGFAANFFEDLLSNGSSAFKNLWENFKRWAFAALAQVAARQLVVSLSGSAAGAGSPVAAFGSDALSSASSSLFGGGAGGMFGAGTLAGGIGGSLMIGAGVGSLVGSFMSPRQQMGTQGGALAGAMIGSYFFPGIGTIIGAALGALLGSLIRSGGGDKLGGSASSLADVGLNSVTVGDMARLFTPSQSDAEVQKLVDSVSRGYVDFARSIGLTAGTAGFSLGFDSDPEGDAPNRVSAQAMVGGRVVYSVADIDVGRDEATLKDRLALEAKRALFAALQATEMPQYLADLFEGIEASAATAEQIDQVLAVASALRIAVDSVRGLGDQFGTMTSENIVAFIDAMGGVESLMERMAFLAENFYTDAQKLDKATELLNEGFEALELSVPETHQAFLDLLNGLDLTTAEGREMYEAISALAPLFVQVNGTAQQAAEALEDAANATNQLGQAAQQVAQTIYTLGLLRNQTQSILGSIDALVGAGGGSAGEQMALRMRLIAEQIANAQAQWYALFQQGISGTDQGQYLLDLIQLLQNANAQTAAELARYTVLTAQYGEARAAELLELERWYADQARLFAGNAEALAALQAIFNERWLEIINGVEQGVTGTINELERLHQSLRDWLKGLSLRQDISPLSPIAKFEEAQKQYLDLLKRAQGGDTDALAQIQGAADQYLQLARQLFASGPQYNSIWQSVIDAIKALLPDGKGGTDRTDPLVALGKALPQNSTLASADDIADMKEEVAGLLRAIAGETRKAASGPVVRAIKRTEYAGARK